nr:reverse transcriptase domain-containing protein [Tanacetum cinerariifolium]
MAGRLGYDDGERLVIECNGEGVLFNECESDCQIDDFGVITPSPELRKLAPTVEYSGDVSSYPLVVLQMDAMTIKMDALRNDYNRDYYLSNSDDKPDIQNDDEDEESTPQPKNQTSKPIKEIPSPKPYKTKIPYPQRLRKKKMEAQYGKFLDMIRAVRINVPLVDVLGMPNYGKFLKELVSNKHKLKQISSAFLSDESSIMIQNKVPPKLGDPESFRIPCTFS